jgi:hypothetical protein
MPNLDKRLKELEQIRRKSMQRAAENCQSEFARNPVIFQIQLNYMVARRWLTEAYEHGYHGDVCLPEIESYIKNSKNGYCASHLWHHLNQIRMLAQLKNNLNF